MEGQELTVQNQRRDRYLERKPEAVTGRISPLDIELSRVSTLPRLLGQFQQSRERDVGRIVTFRILYACCGIYLSGKLFFS